MSTTLYDAAVVGAVALGYDTVEQIDRFLSPAHATYAERNAILSAVGRACRGEVAGLTLTATTGGKLAFALASVDGAEATARGVTATGARVL